MCAGTQKRFNEKTIQKLESVLEISIPDISNDAEAIHKGYGREPDYLNRFYIDKEKPMYTGKFRIPTNRFCFKCHHRIFHSDVKGYPYVCPHCDENMYRFETYTKREKSRYVNPIVNAMKDRKQ